MRHGRMPHPHGADLLPRPPARAMGRQQPPVEAPARLAPDHGVHPRTRRSPDSAGAMPAVSITSWPATITIRATWPPSASTATNANRAARAGASFMEEPIMSDPTMPGTPGTGDMPEPEEPALREQIISDEEARQWVEDDTRRPRSEEAKHFYRGDPSRRSRPRVGQGRREVPAARFVTGTNVPKPDASSDGATRCRRRMPSAGYRSPGAPTRRPPLPSSSAPPAGDGGDGHGPRRRQPRGLTTGSSSPS